MKYQELVLFYKNTQNYKELCKNDQAFFDTLFSVLVLRPIVESNEVLSISYKIPRSTLEKRLNRIEKSGLIIRENKNVILPNGKTRCIQRKIFLNELLFTNLKEVSYDRS